MGFRVFDGGGQDFMRSFLKMPRRRSCCCACVMLLLWSVAAQARGDQRTIEVSPDQKGFVIAPSGKRFVPWGNNYALDLMERLAHDPARVGRDFAEMKAAGANVARIHPEMPAFFSGPNQIDASAVKRLRSLLGIAEKNGMYLHITGLACYRIKQRMAWYDAEDEEHRWNTQALFWETLAKACADSPSVFCYDLVNEPAASAKPSEGWYTGRIGEMEFCQRLSLDPAKSSDDIFRRWTARMVAAIRQYDKKHLITLGMLPFPGYYNSAAKQLDFVSPHIYPESKKVSDAIELLKKFDVGKPIEIGETFPLSCGVDDERKFLLQSRTIAAGWIGHWPDDDPSKLRELKKSGKITPGRMIWLSWIDLFEEVGPAMAKASPRTSIDPPSGR